MTTVTQNEDHELIEVDNALKDKIVVKGMGAIDTSAVTRAEEALEELSVNFDQWLATEIAALLAARTDVRENGLVPPYFDELFRVAHDVKGEGETLGYPLATVIAASLCKLLDTPEDKTVIPLEIIDNHVDALNLVTRDKIRDPQDGVARAVADRLVEVVLEFVDHYEAKQQ